jgi:multidrug efflux pump subunit AcrA (membrane-fusion protein)
MLRVVDQRRLRLTVPVPEAYIAGVSEGAALSFTVPAYPGQTFSGTLARISHNVDVKTRTMAIELDVVNRDGRLAPGTFCQVRWPVRRLRAVAARAERQHRQHDRPHVRGPDSQRANGVG